MKGWAIAAWIAAGATLGVASMAFGTALSQSPGPAPVMASAPTALGFRIAREPVVLAEPTAYDGDTVDDGAERFRIDDLDTAELGNAHCELERQRAEAQRDAARRLLAGADRVVAIPTKTRRDRYGRVLARIEVDGRDFAQAMISEGGAMPYRRPPGWDWCATQVTACSADGPTCGRQRRR